MNDIAKELGLSTTTVSFVINHKAEEMGISEETVKKVNALIKKKGYKPNNAARVLRTGKSNTLALIVEDIGNSFFANIAKIVEMVANKNGYKVFFSSTESDNQIAKSLISVMKQSSVDGFIITATIGLDEEIQRLKKEEIPFVLIDRIIPEISTDSVIIDNFFGGYQLTQHLITQGYKKIAFVTITNGMSQMDDRRLGYIKALEDAKLATDYVLEVPIVDNTNTEQLGIISNYLKEHAELDAVFFATNYLGILGIEAFKENKIQIGKDVAMVSFDDHDLYRLMNPTITVAAQPIVEIGSRAIAILLKKLKKGYTILPPINEVLAPEIIIRESTPKVN